MENLEKFLVVVGTKQGLGLGLIRLGWNETMKHSVRVEWDQELFQLMNLIQICELIQLEIVPDLYS